MRAPLALGILTWDDVLAGFSVPNFWAEKNPVSYTHLTLPTTPYV